MNTEENKNEVKQGEAIVDNNKEAKNYEQNMKKLVAIVGGKENIYPLKRVDNNVVGELVAELLKEQKDELAKNIKVELKGLLDKKVQLEKEVRAKEEELKKLSQQKQKEFNDACAKVFSKIENINKLEEDYNKTLGDVVK
jgi:predicted nucleic acid-binding protein